MSRMQRRSWIGIWKESLSQKMNPDSRQKSFCTIWCESSFAYLQQIAAIRFSLPSGVLLGGRACIDRQMRLLNPSGIEILDKLVHLFLDFPKPLRGCSQTSNFFKPFLRY